MGSLKRSWIYEDELECARLSPEPMAISHQFSPVLKLQHQCYRRPAGEASALLQELNMHQGQEMEKLKEDIRQELEELCSWAMSTKVSSSS